MSPSHPLSLPKIFKAAFNPKIYTLAFLVSLIFSNYCSAGKAPAYRGKYRHAGEIYLKHVSNRGGKMFTGPTISYSSPQTYKAGTAITALAPTSSGVASFGYSGTPVVTASGFSDAFGIAVDAAGDVFLAQPYAPSVSKIPAGGGTPIAVGSGYAGPQGVAVDAAGDVFVADVASSSVKKVAAGGSATITIGTGFSTPTGVAVDAAGNVYVADYGNNAVKEILAVGGSIITLATGFNEPEYLALDGQGNIYVSDYGNNAVKKIPAGGGTATAIGSGFSEPEGVAVDGAGNVYVANRGSGTVQMIPAGGGTVVTVGSGFSEPIGLAIDISGNLYVNALGSDAIEKISPVGGYFISPLLPAGLSFSSTTGTISGTPVVGSPPANYTVTAYSTSGSAAAVINIAVTALTISYSSPQSFTMGTPIASLTPASSGVGAAGNTSGQVTLASGFNAPAGTAIDAGGNIYVADVNNNEIKKIPAGGGTPVILGSGFNKPYGVAVDGSGNVYVADAGNNAVKEIPIGGGSIITLGSGFSNPQGVAVDGSGNVYVADQGNDAVKVIYAGNATPFTLSRSFTSVVGVAVTTAGNIYIADESGGEIFMIPAAGGSPVPVAYIGTPTGIAVDLSGNVYVASHSTNGVYELVAGGSNPILLSGSFSYPIGVAADVAGNVYAADQSANDVEKILPAGGYFVSISLPAGLSINSSTGVISGTPTAYTPAVNYSVKAYNQYGSNSAIVNIAVSVPPSPSISYSSPKSLSINTAIIPLTPSSSGVGAYGYSNFSYAEVSGLFEPEGVAVDKAGNIYVAELDNSFGGILKVPAGGGSPVTIGSGFSSPTGVAVDAAGNVYVADYDNNAVKVIPVAGGIPITIGTGFNGPTGVAVDMAGNVYVADFNNSAVKEIQAVGGATVILGSGFNHPFSVAVDAAGDVYVADVLNSAVKMIPAGNGTPVVIGSGDFIDPYGVAVDASGNLFVAERNGNAVKEIPAGSTAAVAIGSGFSNPYAVAVDGTGNLYVADLQNNTILEVNPVGGYFLNTLLPAGLSFNNNTGAISGKPTVLSPATNYTVTAYNYGGKAQATENLKVVSTDATLSSLALSTGTLTPAFLPATNSYTATIPLATTSVYLTLATNYPSATKTVDGISVPNGSISNSIPLNPGANTVTVVVTAEDGVTTNTYTILVNRGSTIATLSGLTVSGVTLAPAFATATTSYTASVPNATASVEVTAVTSDPTATLTVNGIAETSGTASGAIALNFGANTITTVVTAGDGTTTDTYTITLTRTASSNAKLSYLGLSQVVLSPAFANATTSYTASVASTITSTNVEPIEVGPGATIKVNGVSVASGATTPVALNAGANTINTVVTAQDGVTQITYTVVVTRAGTSAATLSNLTLSSGTLSPSFAGTKTSYTAAVGNTIASITATPTIGTAGETVTVNGTAVASGSASGAIALSVGANTITTVVTNGSTAQTYTVTVTRAPATNAKLSYLGLSQVVLSPAFAAATTSYTASVANTITSTNVEPIEVGPGATIAVNGVAVASGATTPVALNVGSNTINTVVTAQDGVTQLTYTVVVTRAPSAIATLSNLTISSGTLSPVFAGTKTSYTAAVGNTVTSMTETPTTTDPTATVTVNGTAVTSGSASGAIALSVGGNTITTVVTAQNGTTTDTYTVTVTRAPSSNAKLSYLGLSKVVLSPSFAAATTTYTASVVNGIASTNVSPITVDPTATIAVNGVAVASGASTPVTLNVGSNVINTVVTAQDGVTQITYAVTVTRAAPSGAYVVFDPLGVANPADNLQLADDGIVVHQGVSPNGDGIDDYLQIDNITNYPDNKLTIINRNGMLVYEAKGYDNSSRLFDGHSNKNGQMQLPGTYFYSLDYTANGIIKHKTGYLVLKY